MNTSGKFGTRCWAKKLLNELPPASRFWLLLMGLLAIAAVQVVFHEHSIRALLGLTSPKVIAPILILALILDHGIMHLEHRFHEWHGHWSRVVAIGLLALGLVCYAAHVYGYEFQ